MTDHVRRFFAARGLVYQPHPDVVPNSRSALRLAELAREHGLHERFHDHAMEAYWQEGRDIGDSAVLRELAAEAGLPPAAIEDVLSSSRFLDVVEESTRRAVSIGASAVPAFLLDDRLLVLGAQPDEVFDDAIARLRGLPAAVE